MTRAASPYALVLIRLSGDFKALNTSDKQAHEQLSKQALVHFAKQQIEEAVVLWQRALELSPDHLETLVYLGSALRSLGNNSAAVSYYERALTLQPAMPDIYYNLGNIQHDLGDWEKAASCYQKALSLRPEFALAAYNLGNICRDQGRLDEAIQCYRHALAHDPEHAASYNNLGNALKHRGELEQAIPCYEKALHYQPDYPDALYNLGNAFYEMQEFSSAIPWFDKAGIRDAAPRALYCAYKTGQFDDFRCATGAASAGCRALFAPGGDAGRAPRGEFWHAEQLSVLPAALRFCVPRIHARADWRQTPPCDKRYSTISPIAPSTNASRGGCTTGCSLQVICFIAVKRLLVHLPNWCAGISDVTWSVSVTPIANYCEAFPQAREFESSWYIRMQQGGHLTSHIHESGWISGALYLAVPSRTADSDEGCFELSLHGDDYPVVEGAGEFPSRVLPLTVGDIVLFPANLFHRTVPFQADEERVCIAFDLKPGV